MQTRTRDIFTTIRTEGAVLPADVLQRIAEGDGNLEGLKPQDYHLPEGEKLREAISRSWNRLLASWSGFSSTAGRLPDSDPGTSVTRERWLLPLLQELGYGRLPASKSVEIEGKSYPISHFWQSTPIHLIGSRVEIDKRTAGVAGAARISPHGMVQEFLNRSHDHLWAFLSNGLLFRILRDNVSLTRQAYVEFDLAGMMEGEVYSDFVLFWLLCHQSRVEAEIPEKCWLEVWSQAAQEQGTRALDQLRGGVEQAITSLGSGFLSHKASHHLREKLKSGALDKQDYYRQLLRLVYRMIFIFVAEDRGLLLDPQADQGVKDTYVRYYSATKLRRLAEKRRGTQHCDLWRGLSLVFAKLGSDSGCAELALPPLGSYLWSNEAAADIDGCDIANRDLLEAFRHLAFTIEKNVRRVVDYRNLGSEELGSIYESLLELHPELNTDVGAFELTTVSGHERKTTGSYYTPTSLINCLLDSALDPVLNEAAKKKNAEQAILDLKVCDPACGSGHFLVAAAHRMAKRLAAARTGDDEPSPEALRAALRDVIGRCIYGVDLNPMAVELCKVSLWMEALEPGKPLSFLDHHIRCGNSLLGTTPALLAKGIPDEAFNPIEGDDKTVCQEFKKRNKEERKGQLQLFDVEGRPWEHLGNLAASMMDLDDIEDSTIKGVKRKQEKYEKLILSSGYEYGRFLADAWCATFVWKKTKEFAYPITQDVLRKIERNPHDVAPWMKDEIKRLAEQYQFFHWHLAFPDVFRLPGKGEALENEQTGWSGGFDAVLSNPPWERVSLEGKQFFANSDPQIANAKTTAERKRLIAQLPTANPRLFEQYQRAMRTAAAETLLLASSGLYPLGAQGRINTYAVFTELAQRLADPRGACGLIVPTGIATDEPLKNLFKHLGRSSLRSLYDFENRNGIFPGVHRSYKFCLLTTRGQRPEDTAPEFAFFLQSVHELAEADRRFGLTVADLDMINPITSTCPLLRSLCDVFLLKAAHSRHPIWMHHSEDGQECYELLIMFISESGSEVYRDEEWLQSQGFLIDAETKWAMRDAECYLPLLEAKLIHQFDLGYAEYGNGDVVGMPGSVSVPKPVPRPRFWVPFGESESKYEARRWQKRWAIGFRGVARSTDVRTAIATVLPRLPMMQHLDAILPLTSEHALHVLGVFNSYVFDYFARLKVPTINLNFTTLRQLPLLPFRIARDSWLWRLTSYNVLELAYVGYSLEPFAQDCGYDGPPFRWDEERRFLLRCELDAAYFHLYLPTAANGEWRMASRAEGCPYDETPEQLMELKKHLPTPRDAVSYIMETFPIVKRKDERQYGEYRTKRVILEIYDEMKEAMEMGRPYKTVLDPPAADPRVAHPPRGGELASPASTQEDWRTELHTPQSSGSAAQQPSIATATNTEPGREDMPDSDSQSMDEAANDASIELEAIREGHPEAIKAIEDWMEKWVPSAGYKRLGKILAGRWG